jgi:hypothetical protein
LLFGLAPADPGTIAGAILVMVLLSACAGYLPARRASRVDPMVALRYERMSARRDADLPAAGRRFRIYRICVRSPPLIASNQNSRASAKCRFDAEELVRKSPRPGATM